LRRFIVERSPHSYFFPIFLVPKFPFALRFYLESLTP